MKITADELDGRPIFRVEGDLDHGGSPLLTALLGERLPGHIDGPVFLDLSVVTYIDSGGLSALSRLLSRCEEGAWVGLVSPSPQVYRLIEGAGLTIRRQLKVFLGESRGRGGAPTGRGGRSDPGVTAHRLA